MDIDALKTFVEVARLGSFAAVAHHRELDPSSISRSMAALEAQLGVRLLQRTTRKLSLTEAGHVYLGRVASIVDELDNAKDEALTLSKGVSGTLRMTASVSFSYEQLAPLLPEFRALHPRLKLELLMTDSNLDLVNDRIDLAIRLSPRVSGNAVCTRLMQTSYRVCASPAYIKQKGAPAHPQELSQHQCVLLALPEFRNEWHFKDMHGNVQDVPIQGEVVISNALVQQRCAIDAMGPALLVDWLTNDAIAAGTLVDLFPSYQVSATTFDTGVWLLYPSRSYLPLKVRLMLDFLKEKFTA
jgi:DNA-binding transcriptional LysR family regulator